MIALAATYLARAHAAKTPTPSTRTVHCRRHHRQVGHCAECTRLAIDALREQTHAAEALARRLA